ncbi:DsbA family oxidoreductase [Quisquiliibacterium transsilvanicum]|uniref:Putative DsbA family dithiol-disulfide isomerase n=1 Tax=Quisquiliibacterium transsilvanicum TaxID=1549638 RepID=A0A7W8HE36_9BURK|nr:DsbA family oxidoreductase [Quisquiliibacterium transsilvanicum]MBB5270369.1 putative DsbA family dithiol-disulfide isomerase [Quisquiliibacterium transsilvanicum]
MQPGSEQQVANFRIDVVSDVSCPWCAVGLGALEQALENLKGEVGASIHFQPFELNPDMPPGGQDVTEHLTQKYGSSPQAQARFREQIRERGLAVGFEFRQQGRSRIWNTFDAHRLLHWAGEEGRPEGADGAPGQQRLLKKALFKAYFTRDESPESHEVLLRAVAEAGMDEERARAILAGDDYSAEVREREAFYREQDIHSVPAIIIDGRHLIPGAQPADVFERVLRKLASRGPELA